MDSRPIGVFDSGLGGLTAVRKLLEVLPGEDIVYLGDTGRVPYGGKSRETILRYALDDTAFLMRRNVKSILVACGTVSSNAIRRGAEGRRGYPRYRHRGPLCPEGRPLHPDGKDRRHCHRRHHPQRRFR